MATADVVLDETPSGHMPAFELVEADINLHVANPSGTTGPAELRANVDVAHQYAEQMGYVKTTPLDPAQQQWCFDFFYSGKHPDDYRKGYRFLINCGSGYVYATPGY
jgi:hypothetical protein